MDRGIREFMQSGLLAEENKLYIAAADAYFKAITHVADHHIFKKYGQYPDNHAERFRILEIVNKPLYELLGGLFKIYRKSYRDMISYDDMVSIKHGLKRAIGYAGLEKEFKEFLQET